MKKEDVDDKYLKKEFTDVGTDSETLILTII